jgi:phosphoribosylanthranilate isomerase
MKIKVCGLKNETNIIELVRLGVDYLGFIFYEKSPRFVGNRNDVLQKLLPNIQAKKVGVFVGAEVELIVEKVQKFGLDVVQLHGYENANFCENLQTKFQRLHLPIEIIKVFSVGEEFDFSDCEAFMPYADYFLFDTKGKNLGGNGIAFDWNVLKNYHLNKPFFLSGGIDLQHAEILKNLQNPALYALDINSRFEIEAGLKDTKKIQKFISLLSNQTNSLYCI